MTSTKESVLRVLDAKFDAYMASVHHKLSDVFDMVGVPYTPLT